MITWRTDRHTDTANYTSSKCLQNLAKFSLTCKRNTKISLLFWGSIGGKPYIGLYESIWSLKMKCQICWSTYLYVQALIYKDKYFVCITEKCRCFNVGIIGNFDQTFGLFPSTDKLYWRKVKSRKLFPWLAPLLSWNWHILHSSLGHRHGRGQQWSDGWW